jgi:hypothetical protein
MKPLLRGDHRRTRSSLPVSSRMCGTRQIATHVSTHLKEERVGLSGRPISVRRALLRLDHLTALSTRDNNENNQVTPSAAATPADVPHNVAHRIASRHPP